MEIFLWDSGFCLWHPDLGCCLWASRDQTPLGIELRMQFFRSIHYGDRFVGFRILPLGVRQAHSAQWTVYAVSSQFIMWIGSWDLGCCLWVSGDQTLLGIELCMQFWVDSLQGSAHRIWHFASERPGSTHCSALNCVCSFRSIHYRDRFMGFGSSPMGVWRSNTAQQRSVYAVSFQFITGLVHGIWFLPLGVRGANTALHRSVYTVSCKSITVKPR